MNAIPTEAPPPIKDDKWHAALALALVDHLDLDGRTPIHSRVAELLAPLAKAAVDRAFNEALDRAATDREALDLFRERMTRLYTCRCAENAFAQIEAPRLRQLKGR